MADRGEPLLSLYAHLTGLARPAGRMLLAARRSAGKEHAARWRERLGRPSAARPPGPLVWVHAASVGETVSVMPLVEGIAGSGVTVLLTTGTTTSADMVAARDLGPFVIHQFAALDMRPYVERFLNAWAPRLAVFVESEIWPVTVKALADRRVPLVVANGRMSERSFAGWSRFPAAAAAIFGRIGLCLAQTGGDAERFRRLGVGRVVSVGNIKFDAPVPEAAPAEAAALRQSIGTRPVLLAASTHEGEDEIVLDAARLLAGRVPRLLTVLAPRHPARGEAVAALAAAGGFETARRGAGDLPAPSTAVYVADTVGELGTLYRLATVALVGGSLVERGGHNPIEPARLGTPVLSGPNVRNFAEVYAALEAAGAVRTAEGAEALAEAAAELLTDPAAHRAQAAAASGVVDRLSGALGRTVTALDPHLAPLALEAQLKAQEGGA